MTVTKDTFGHLKGNVKIYNFDAIVDAPSSDPNEIHHIVQSNIDSIFTWDYSRQREGLKKIYEKAKSSQWDGATALDWSTDVDVEKSVAEDYMNFGTSRDMSVYKGSPVEHWGQSEWLEFGVQSRRWMISQFIHGEQAALMCSAKISMTCPWYDGKLYASTQVMDEARHTEVFSRYASEKLGGVLPFNWHIQSLVDDTISDSRWDMTYLGMQIMVEGLGLASMAYMRELTAEPLLKQLLRNVMSDEARHISFGVLTLREVYSEMTDSEIMERQEFAFEATLKLGERMLQQEVFEKMGVKTKDIAPYLLNDPAQAWIRRMLSAKIVPNVSKLGLLDRNGKWLRRKYEEMGIIEFENIGESEEDFVEFIHKF
jgi:hypothetical protein